jgi:hypothetical protein
MPRTLLKATIVTLFLGTTLLWLGSGRPTDRWWQLLAIPLSVAAGAILILRRKTSNAIPLTAVFVVVMFAALLFVTFLLAARQGGVEF